MSQQPLAVALAQLASSDRGRSETARLRDVLDQVEAALDAGVSRQAILDELHQRGFTMTLRGFETALYRLRQKRLKAGTKKTAQASRTTPLSAPVAVAGIASVSNANETEAGAETEPETAAPAPAVGNPEAVLDTIANAEERDQRYDAMFQRRPARPKSTR